MNKRQTKKQLDARGRMMSAFLQNCARRAGPRWVDPWTGAVSNPPTPEMVVDLQRMLCR
jgi:hypothetical protein